MFPKMMCSPKKLLKSADVFTRITWLQYEVDTAKGEEQGI